MYFDRKRKENRGRRVKSKIMVFNTFGKNRVIVKFLKNTKVKTLLKHDASRDKFELYETSSTPNLSLPIIFKHKFISIFYKF